MYTGILWRSCKNRLLVPPPGVSDSIDLQKGTEIRTSSKFRGYAAAAVWDHTLRTTVYHEFMQLCY
jgi:hypothetical protein